MWYWSIGTDIHLDFPTEEEYKEAKRKVSEAYPILCKTCMHENNCDGQCGFYNSKIWDDEKKEMVPANICGNCTGCTYYDPTEVEAARIEKLMEQVKALNTDSTLATYKILHPKAYEVYVELIKKYGCDPL